MTDKIVTPFYFIRHAPVVKRDGHLPPQDPPITEGPFAALDALHARLPQNADWYISPLLRTRQTADLLKTNLAPCSVCIEERLKEMDFGEWHDQPVEDVWNTIATGPRHNWSFIMPDVIPPGGESFATLCKRVISWMEEQTHQPVRRPQVVVAHAGVLSAAIGHILDLEASKSIGISIPHFGLLRANLMPLSHAKDAGGPWQFVGLD